MTEAPPKTLRELILDQPRFKGLLLWSVANHRRLLQFPHSYRPDSKWALRHGMTEERFQQLQDEEAFLREPGQSVAAFRDRAERERVYRDPASCPLCFGSREAPAIYRGRKTGIRVVMGARCPCDADRMYFSVWFDTTVVPLEHREFTWEALVRGDLRDRMRVSTPVYRTILTTLHAYPLYNIFLCGDKGRGKTTLFTALFDHVLERWAQTCYEQNLVTEACWKVKATRLADELFQMRRPRDQEKEGVAPVATVNMDKVKAAISHPELQCALFLDEADKWGKTEMVKNYLTNFVDDMTTQQAQVVLSSQVDLGTLISMIGTTYGDSIMRRLVGKPRGIYINLQTGIVAVNLYQQTVNRTTGGGWELVDVPDRFLISSATDNELRVPPEPTPFRWDFEMFPDVTEADDKKLGLRGFGQTPAGVQGKPSPYGTGNGTAGPPSPPQAKPQPHGNPHPPAARPYASHPAPRKGAQDAEVLARRQINSRAGRGSPGRGHSGNGG